MSERNELANEIKEKEMKYSATNYGQLPKAQDATLVYPPPASKNQCLDDIDKMGKVDVAQMKTDDLEKHLGHLRHSKDRFKRDNAPDPNAMPHPRPSKTQGTSRTHGFSRQQASISTLNSQRIPQQLTNSLKPGRFSQVSFKNKRTPL